MLSCYLSDKEFMPNKMSSFVYAQDDKVVLRKVVGARNNNFETEIVMVSEAEPRQ